MKPCLGAEKKQPCTGTEVKDVKMTKYTLLLADIKGEPKIMECRYLGKGELCWTTYILHMIYFANCNEI